MGTAKLVGRVGPLAVALGIGIALAATQAVAWARPGRFRHDSSSHVGRLVSRRLVRHRRAWRPPERRPCRARRTRRRRRRRDRPRGSTGSPISQVTSPSGRLIAATRSAEPGVVVSTSSARTGSKTSEDADRAALEKKSASSSSIRPPRRQAPLAHPKRPRPTRPP